MNFERMWHWERFEPQLGNNLDAPESQRLFFDVAVGLTKVEIEKVIEVLATYNAASFEPVKDADGKVDQVATDAAWPAHLDKLADDLAKGWGPYVRLGAGEHAIDGKPLKTLRDYLRFVVEQLRGFNVFELFRVIDDVNSVRGKRALFSGPPSGGSTSTPRPNAAPAGSQTGGR